MHYVYILHSDKKKQLYKGSTSNLKERFRQHNRGEVASTKLEVPWELVYYEAFSNKTDALREELFFEKRKGKR